jgi:endonuclease YncB( thermonuclease family)
MNRLILAFLLMLAGIGTAQATCGERGGPGFRGPNGKCVAWVQIGRVCGSPPEMRCTREGEADGARAVAEAQETSRARPPADRAKAAAFGLMSMPVLPTADSASLDGVSETLDPETTSIVDGDTIEVGADRKRVRLVGFNAPETAGAACERERDLGAKASKRLSDLIASEPAELQPIACACRAGTEGTPACNYGRACGILKVAGVDVGRTLISEGLAVPFTCSKTRCPSTPRPWCLASPE